ncbi:UDP-N-acetylmuramate dehydrogenase [Kiritimatiellota bacterium B12222]|nr:UDP-N-acetylmuramate dehydrogenase [Kiritimatiellota bacterium B12222]
MSRSTMIQPLRDAGYSIEEQVPLAELGTFHLGGPLRWLLRLSHSQDLLQVRQLCLEHDIPVFLFGEGSNILFSDAGWPGLGIRFVQQDAVPREEAPGVWTISAACSLQDVVAWAVAGGWAGLEAFTGIPGTVGGAVVGNAGAWGVQMEHVLTRVKGVNAEGQFQTCEVADCNFSYRNSDLKHNGFWVSDIQVRLQAGDSAALMQEHRRILALRASKHPDWQREPCIGSFFKNLEPSSAAERRQAAGYFLEQVGAKTKSVGGAGVFADHANILIKRDAHCRAEDVAALARELQQAVKSQFDIDLVREVRYLGEIQGEQSATGFY